MKKILCVITGLAVFAAMSSTAFAAPLDAGTLQSDTQSVQAIKLAADPSAAQQNLAFRQTVLQDREAILNNAAKNTDQVSKNRQLRLQTEQAILTFKQNGEKLTSDAKTQLENYNSQLKTLTSSLSGTKGQVKTAMDAFRAAVKAKDSSALQAALNQVTSVQDNRNSLLTQINGILQQINDLVSSSGSVTSAAPSATPSASATT